MTALITLLGVAVLLLGVLVAGLLRSHADVLRTLHDLGANEDELSRAGPPDQAAARVAGAEAAGGRARDLLGRSPTGATVAVTVDGAAHSTLLAFLTSGCATCRGFWDAFADPSLVLPAAADRLVVVTKSEAHESPGAIAGLAPRHTSVVMSDDAWDAYGVPVAPYFVLVDGPTGSIAGEGAALNWHQVSGLLARATADGLASRSPARPGPPSDRDSPARVDAELRAAGIEPGHPSLYPQAEADPRPEPSPPGAELAHGTD